jgi:hypothetical protein
VIGGQRGDLLVQGAARLGGQLAEPHRQRLVTVRAVDDVVRAERPRLLLQRALDLLVEPAAAVARVNSDDADELVRRLHLGLALGPRDAVDEIDRIVDACTSAGATGANVCGPEARSRCALQPQSTSSASVASLGISGAAGTA